MEGRRAWVANHTPRPISILLFCWSIEHPFSDGILAIRAKTKKELLVTNQPLVRSYATSRKLGSIPIPVWSKAMKEKKRSNVSDKDPLLQHQASRYWAFTRATWETSTPRSGFQAKRNIVRERLQLFPVFSFFNAVPTRFARSLASCETIHS